MVLLERAQHRREIGMGGRDRREQGAVLAGVVGIQRAAEPVAEQQQLPGGILGGITPIHGLAGDAQGFAQARMHAPYLVAPGDEPGRLALSHARTTGATKSSSVSLGSAPPCLTRSATGTRRWRERYQGGAIRWTSAAGGASLGR